MDASPPTLRPAVPEDAPALLPLLEQLGYPTSADAVRPRLRALLSAPGDDVLVAEDADGLAGLATYQVFTLIYRSRPQCRLTALVVDSRRRRRGIGRTLLAEVERLAHRLAKALDAAGGI